MKPSGGMLWILKIKPSTVRHICEFFTLSMVVHDFRHDGQVKDEIIWKHANDGIYSADGHHVEGSVSWLDSITLPPMDRMV